MSGPTVGVLPVANFQIDYASELDRIKDFLSRYVPERGRPSRRSRPEDELPSDDDDEAEDELADDIDNLDVGQSGRSKAKYMKRLRKVANRQSVEVVVDLADLRKVR